MHGLTDPSSRSLMHTFYQDEKFSFTLKTTCKFSSFLIQGHSSQIKKILRLDKWINFNVVSFSHSRRHIPPAQLDASQAGIFTGLYRSSPLFNLLLSSCQSSFFSFLTFFRTPLFSMARLERYGRTSSTGP